MNDIKRDLLGQHALDIMEGTQESLFLTGKAGTGKTTLLRYFLDNTVKNVVVLASTGIAAINVGGQTIHSFFRFGNHVSPDLVDELTGRNMKLLYEADAIVIDEVSMVRADLMDSIDYCMRLSMDIDAPFAGKQMIFVGDLYQLPPVVTNYEAEAFDDLYATPYFFGSKAYQNLYPHVISLQEVHRQRDTSFSSVLNRMRLGLHTSDDMELLHDECLESDPHPESVYLCTTNRQAEALNEYKLLDLESELFECDATISGKVPTSMYPNMTVLPIKVGAQIMMTKNGKGYSNGSIGTLVEYDSVEELAIVKVNGKEHGIPKHTWKVMKPKYDKELKQIVPEPVGSFTQFPFKLARAITIHKAQGLTFDNIVVDLSQGAFSQGQTYVALSRATSLAGLSLTKKIAARDVIVDRAVQKYMHAALYEQTAFLVHTAIEQKKGVQFLYNAPEGPRIVEIKPTEIGEMEHEGYEFVGLKGKEGKKDCVFSYGRIFDLQVV